MSGSLPRKLYLRQIFGGQKLPGGSKPIKYYEKCPESFQIPLRKICNYESFNNGHVYVGFSSDGKYLLSYQCKLSFQMDTEPEPVCYNYILHWWLFDLWQPIKKVCQVQLFAHESIHYELHILICQPPNADYIVVHGSTYSVDTQSNGKMTYVSIIPTDVSNRSIHLRYELLSPHPPFVTSISLKLQNVILLNSGDMLFAILLNKYICDDSTENNRNDNNSTSCYCQRLLKTKIDKEDFRCNIDYSPGDSCDICTSDETCVRHHIEYYENCNKVILTDKSLTVFKVNETSMNIYDFPSRNNEHCNNVIASVANETYPLHIPEESSSPGETVDTPASCASPVLAKAGEGVFIPKSDVHTLKDTNSIAENGNDYISRVDECFVNDTIECNKEYVSYVMQGFSLPTEEGSTESLPASPFDCTQTVLPCHLSSYDGNEVLKHTYEHRCFRTADKGNKSECDYFICQAQFDAENFVNEEVQLCDDISRRYVSMRDYDMQVVDVCQETNEVVILINALVVFRDIVQRDDKLNSMNSQLNKLGLQRENCYKLILYTLGYIVSWNVYTGGVTVLKRYPIVEGPGTICKSRQFAPSLSQTVQLRKGFFVPSAKNASVQTLSNHTVFSGKSLQYLFNPVLPVAVVM